MRVLLLHGRPVQGALWGTSREMKDSLQRLFDLYEPDILMTKEWAAPTLPPETLAETVRGIAVPDRSILLVNGALEAFEEEGRNYLATVDAISYSGKDGRTFSFFPKRGEADNASDDEPYAFPDAPSGIWRFDPKEEGSRTVFRSKGMPKAILPLFAARYPEDSPAVAEMLLPGSDKPLRTWLPICSDVSPAPDQCDLALYAASGGAFGDVDGKGRLTLYCDPEEHAFSVKGSFRFERTRVVIEESLREKVEPKYRSECSFQEEGGRECRSGATRRLAEFGNIRAIGSYAHLVELNGPVFGEGMPPK